MSNFVDYSNMTSLMTAIKSAIDNAGGGGSVGWTRLDSSAITSFDDIKIGDIVWFDFASTAVPGTRHKIKFSAASSASATISAQTTFGVAGTVCAVVVKKLTYSAELAFIDTNTSSTVAHITLTSLTSGGVTVAPGIDADYLGTTSGSNAYSLYIRSGGYSPCSISNLSVFRVTVQ